MKKVVNLTWIIHILLLFYITSSKDILALTISFSMYILIGSIFSSIKMAEDRKELKTSLIGVLLLFVHITLLSYLLGNFLNIEKLSIVNIVMSITLMTNIIKKILKEYLEKIGYKKINNITNFQNIIVYILNTIILILLFEVIDIKPYLSIIILYFTSMLTSTILIFLFIKLILKNNQKNNKININDIKHITRIIISNSSQVTYNVINSAYIYISIITLYFTLSNKYNYNYETISSSITNTYFYGMIIIYYINKIIKKYLNIDIKSNFNNSLNKIIKVLLPMSILLTIISKPLSNILFDSNQNIIVSLIPLLFIYILYDFTLNTSREYTSGRNNSIILILGLIFKVIFEIPLINSIYRMGYNLINGSIISIALGLIVSIVISLIIIKNKLKLNLLDNFNNLLNIIYENIIYTLILVLFTFIIKIDTNTMISSLLVSIFYILVTIIFYFIKIKLNQKDK